MFSFIVLCQTAGSEIFTLQVSSELLRDISKVDSGDILKKVLIDEISQAIEGVSSIMEEILNIILYPVKQLIKDDQEAISKNLIKDEKVLGECVD